MTNYMDYDSIDTDRYALEIKGVDGWYEIATGKDRKQLTVIYNKTVKRNRTLIGIPYRIVSLHPEQIDHKQERM